MRLGCIMLGAAGPGFALGWLGSLETFKCVALAIIGAVAVWQFLPNEYR